MSFKLGDKVTIATLWADKDYPNTKGTIIATRHGDSVAIVETKEGISPRTLHINYLNKG